MEIAKYWDHQKNNDVDFTKFTHGSNIKFWFKCPDGYDHEWFTKINKITLGSYCPFCIGRRVCYSNSVAGVNPEVAKEWHPYKNNKNASEVVAGSSYRAWWVCKYGHEWKAPIVQRAIHNTKCPYCCNQKVSIENSLAVKFPHLVKEWNYKRNIYLPSEVAPNSNKKVWWQCLKFADHEWETAVSNRVKGKGCSYCSSKFVCHSNCLATKCPELVLEWHEKNDITPDKITSGTGLVVWWRCINNKKHEWQARVDQRSGPRKNGCPLCCESRGEKRVVTVLKEIYPNFKRQYTTNKCKNIFKLRFDFALLKNDSIIALIEYNGIQHYIPVAEFGGDKGLAAVQKNDNIKKEYCSNNGIPFLIIDYSVNSVTDIRLKIEEFLKEIDG